MKKLTIMLVSVFLLAVVACENPDVNVIEEQPEAETVSGEEVSDELLANAKELSNKIDEFKSDMSSESPSRSDLQESIDGIEETASEGLQNDFEQEYATILEEWVDLSEASIFDNGKVSDDEFNDWFDQYNDLVNSTSEYYKEVSKK